MPYPGLAPRNPYGPQVTFLTHNVPPPAERYLGPSDQIILSIRVPYGVAAVTIGVRLLTLRGEVMPIREIYVNLTSPPLLPILKALEPIEAFLLDAIVTATGVQRGQCFCQLLAKRSAGAAQTFTGALLAQGYVSDVDALGFPQSQPESSLAPPGFIRIVPFNGGGASTFNFPVPPGVRWVLLALAVQNTSTDPGPTGIRIQLSVLDAGGALIEQAFSNFGYNGILTSEMSFGIDLSPDGDVTNSNANAWFGFPLHVPPGGSIFLDQTPSLFPSVFGLGRLMVEEWIEV